MRSVLTALICLLAAPAATLAAAGDLDTRFGTGGQLRIAATASDVHARGIAVQPDGRVLVTGVAGGNWFVQRVSGNGRRDVTFGNRGRADLGTSGEPLALALQRDGRILVGGSDRTNGEGRRAVVVRLTREGAPDPSWGDGGRAVIEAPARIFFGGLAPAPDGGVLVATSVHDTDQRFVVWRLGPDGRLDRGFGLGGAYVDGAPGSANAVAVQPGGRIVAAGATGPFNGTHRELVLALTPSGALDTGWGAGGRFLGPAASHVRHMAMTPGGEAVALDSLPRDISGVLWLRADGTRRGDWGLEGRAAILGFAHPARVGRLAIAESGEIYVTGVQQSSGGRLRAGLVRIDRRGLTDTAFGGRDAIATLPSTRQTVRSAGESVALGPGDRVYVAASGAGELPDLRQDFGFPHLVLARFKGWPELGWMQELAARRGSRRVTGFLHCASLPDYRCRFRVDVLDRRGRRVGRARRTGGGRLTVRLARPARRGERLTLRLSVTDAHGRADTSTRTVSVPRR